MMVKRIALICSCLIWAISCTNNTGESQTVTMDPNDLQFNDYVHESLSESLLERIKATTDIFEPVDGISFEQTVDMYRRDLNPEKNIIIWEEMARVFVLFCEGNCQSKEKKYETYKLLLLLSMFPLEQAIQHLNPQLLSKSEVEEVSSMYALEPTPIETYRK